MRFILLTISHVQVMLEHLDHFSKLSLVELPLTLNIMKHMLFLYI